MFSNKTQKSSVKAGNSKRKAVPRKQSEAEFSRTASKTHVKNMQGAPMRGGIRL